MIIFLGVKSVQNPIEIVPQVYVPDIQAGSSFQDQNVSSNQDVAVENNVISDEDKMCIEVLDTVENLGLYDLQG